VNFFTSISNFIYLFIKLQIIQSILFVELMVVLHGLQLCWENEFRRILCYSDSLQTVNLIGMVSLRTTDSLMKFLIFVNSLLESGMLWLTTCFGKAMSMRVRTCWQRWMLSTDPLVKFSTPPSDLSLPLLA
jgi:hypothetical protein